MMTSFDDGVVQTFKPSYEVLVGLYLYNRIDHIVIGPTTHVFPLLDLYGEAGMQPWALADHLEPNRIPHQEFYYFYARLKSLSPKGRGKRCFRRVGSGETMGTWSETETSKAVSVYGVPFGRVKKFRYENTKSEHHGAWMMEEFSIDHCDVPSSDLVLCRIKRNEKGGCGRKRKAVIESGNEANAKMPRCYVEAEQHQMVASVDDLVYGGNVVDHQSGLEQGCSTSTSAHHQLEYCNNVDAGNGVIVSQNEDAGFENDGTTWQFANAKIMPKCSVEAEQNEIILVDDFFCDGNVADQGGLEQGCSNKNDVSASRIEDAKFQGEGNCWLDDYALEEEPLDTSLFGNHIVAGGDVQPITDSQSRLEEEGTDYNSSTSQVVPPRSFSSDQMTSTPPSTSSQQQDMFSLPSIDDQVASGFAWDNAIISTDASLCYQIEDFGFLFENQILPDEEEATMPQTQF